MAKLQPAVMTFNYPIGLIDGSSTQKTIDLSQSASILNRRFYRQGLQWVVAGFTLHSVSDNGSVEISKLPQNWVTSASWEKTMRYWLKQQNEAIEENGAQSSVARYRDFKIHMDKTHVDSGFPANYIPFARQTTAPINWTQFQSGEWQPSFVVVPNANDVPGNTQTFNLHMIGDDDAAPQQSKSMVKAYTQSRSVPQSPDPQNAPLVQEGLFGQMFDDGETNEEVIGNAINRNNDLPYVQVDYPGGPLNGNGLEFHDTLSLTTTTVSAKTSCRGGMFPAGLIRLRIDPTLGATPTPEGLAYTSWLQVHMVPGDHRGYLAETMMEM